MHLIWAFRAFFRALAAGEKALAPAESQAPPPPVDAFKSSPEPAIQLLGLLQKDGRLLDFLMEDIASYSDAEVGAAVRQIHESSRKVLRERMKLERIITVDEGASFEVPSTFDASTITLIGNVHGTGPWRGNVRHRGWRVRDLNLPTIPAGSDATVAQPAEIELT